MESLSHDLALREWVPYYSLPHPQRLLSWWAAPRDAADALDGLSIHGLTMEEAPWRA